MIVKNEAPRLERCVRSVWDLVDEIVIADTGSDDGTPDIARELVRQKGAGQVVSIEFRDFVQAKNDALAYASGAYILWMDADEILEGDGSVLRRAAEQGLNGAVNIPIEERVDGKVVLRYFRPRLWIADGWKFAGPGVHEVPVGPGEQRYETACWIWHNRDHRTPESYAQRSEMYLRILREHIAQNDSDTRAWFYYARTLMEVGRRMEAVSAFRKTLSLSTWRDERYQCCLDIAECLLAEGEFQQALEWCERAVLEDERRAEAFVTAGRIHYMREDWVQALRSFEAALQRKPPEDVLLFLRLQDYLELPLDYLTIIYDKLGRHDLSLAAARKLCEIDGYKDERRFRNLQYFTRKNTCTWFFALGHTPERLAPFGGVETTYIELPKALAAMGRRVFVFARVEREFVRDGVYFVPYANIRAYRDLRPDILVASRWFEPYAEIPARKRILWLQDAHYPDAPHGIVERVVVSSHWHRDYSILRGIPPQKLRVIPLGIWPEQFHPRVQRENLCIYSHNPNRGLDQLMELWPAIRELLNEDHQLVIAYGWEGLRTWSDDPRWQEYVNRHETGVRQWARENNAIVVGRLDKPTLYDLMGRCKLALYPCTFWETFCLTALETQASGVPMVTTRLGALPEVLGAGNVLIEGFPGNEEYDDEFVKWASDLLNNPEELSRRSSDVMGNVAGFDWPSVARMWIAEED